MSRCTRARRRLRPRLWPPVTNYRPATLRRCSRGWSTPRFSRACAMSLSTADPEDLGANSVLLERVIDPAVRKAGKSFLANLDSISVEQMCETAERAHVLDDEEVSDFAI